ncbi:lariat debranching enzyme, partial [Rhizophlyctis rosea]
MAVPEHYRNMGAFHKYYRGEKVAPVPTVFIGGNHEASQYLWELFHGGYVAPNIYFLGFAGVINVGGLRIGGYSGIYKGGDYRKGYFEKQPYSPSDCRSIYHLRQYNTFRLAQIKEPIDIMLSHDWPRGIYFHGNTRRLIQMKPFLLGEINTNSLGSPPAEELLKLLKPSMWFSAHLHVKFAALYNHNAKAQDFVPDALTAMTNPDEIDIDDDDMDDLEHDHDDDDVKAEGVKKEEEEEEDVKESAADLEHKNGSQSEQGADVPEAGADVPPASEKEEVKVKYEPSEPRQPTPALSDATIEPAAAPEGDDETADAKEEDQKGAVPIEEDQASRRRSVAGSETGGKGLVHKGFTPPNMKLPVITKPEGHAAHTRFLALDKCLPNKDFLQIIDLPDAHGPLDFYYDEEWLAIVRAMWPYFSQTEKQTMPQAEAQFRTEVEKHRTWLKENVVTSPDALRIPNGFVVTAEMHARKRVWTKNDFANYPNYRNPQTQYLADLLQVENNINPHGKLPDATNGTKRLSVDEGSVVNANGKRERSEEADVQEEDLHAGVPHLGEVHQVGFFIDKGDGQEEDITDEGAGNED